MNSLSTLTPSSSMRRPSPLEGPATAPATAGVAASSCSTGPQGPQAASADGWEARPAVLPETSTSSGLPAGLRAASASTSTALNRFSGLALGGGREAPTMGPTMGPTAGPTTTAAAIVAPPPLSGAQWLRSLSDAVVSCIRARPPSDDAQIADKLASFVFTDTARDFVAAVRRGEHPLLSEVSPAALERGLTGEASRPSFVHMLSMNGRTAWGGMALLRNDVFPEGFYRTRASSSVAPHSLDKAQYSGKDFALLFEQPYFRWNGQSHDFHLGDKDDNANTRLIDHLVAQSGPQVDLWRGTQAAYDSVDEILTVGDDGRYRAGAMSTFGDDFGSVMTTPDRTAAEGWASPVLLRFSFAADELKAMAREGLLYAGIEYEYLEIALLYDRDPSKTRGQDSLRRLQSVASSTSASVT
jgi:hypothetical protein